MLTYDVTAAKATQSLTHLLLKLRGQRERSRSNTGGDSSDSDSDSEDIFQKERAFVETVCAFAASQLSPPRIANNLTGSGGMDDEDGAPEAVTAGVSIDLAESLLSLVQAERMKECAPGALFYLYRCCGTMRCIFLTLTPAS